MLNFVYIGKMRLKTQGRISKMPTYIYANRNTSATLTVCADGENSALAELTDSVRDTDEWRLDDIVEDEEDDEE